MRKTHPKVVGEVHSHVGTAIRSSYYLARSRIRISASAQIARNDDAETYNTHGIALHSGARSHDRTTITMCSTTRCRTVRSTAAAIRRNVSVSPGVASGTGALERGDKGQLGPTVSLFLSRRRPPLSPPPFALRLPLILSLSLTPSSAPLAAASCARKRARETRFLVMSKKYSHKWSRVTTTIARASRLSLRKGRSHAR